MPKRSDAAEYAAPATEVLPKPTCNMSSLPSQSTSCELHPGRAGHPWLRPDVSILPPCNFRPPDEFATSVNVDTGGEFKMPVATLALPVDSSGAIGWRCPQD